MEIGVFNKTDKVLNKDLTKLKSILEDLCDKEKLSNVIFNIIIVDEHSIKEINSTYRGIDKSTDVISFALEDDKTVVTPENIRILGDIYICIEKVISQAEEYGHSFERELTFLAVHGFLHLLGYDHMNKEEEEKMFKKQKEVLEYYGIVR